MDVEVPISWYPGHMAQAKRRVREAIRLVDGVIEVVDARLPAGSSNPDLQELLARRPRLIVATKSDLADPVVTAAWLEYWEANGIPAIAVSLETPEEARSELLRAMGRLVPRPRSGTRAGVKWMVVGIPNVGKSTLINCLAKSGRVRTGAKPGVTRGTQWIRLAGGHHLLDTPGILWPKLDPPERAMMLAWIGSIGDAAWDPETVARALIAYLQRHHPALLAERFDLASFPSAGDPLEAIAAQRKMVRKGGVPDVERAAQAVLKEFRAGKLGRVSLERPPVASEGDGTGGGEPT